MKVFKRASAAYAAAGNDPVLTIENGSETLYVVGIERLTTINLIGRPEARGYSRHASRLKEAHVTVGHLSRLGNANHAGSARFNYEANSFDNKGLGQRFLSESDAADYEATKEAEKQGWKRGDYVRHTKAHFSAGPRPAPIKRFLGDDGVIKVETYGSLLEGSVQNIYPLDQIEKIDKESVL